MPQGQGSAPFGAAMDSSAFSCLPREVLPQRGHGLRAQRGARRDDDRALFSRLPCDGPYGRHGSRGAAQKRRTATRAPRPRLVWMRRRRNRFKASARASCGDGYRAARATPCLLAHPFAPPRRTSNLQERRAGRPLGRERSQPRYPSEQEFPAGADFHSDQSPTTAARRLPELRHDPRFAKEHASPFERTCRRCRRDSIAAL